MALIIPNNVILPHELLSVCHCKSRKRGRNFQFYQKF